jgi:inner membrane protein
MLLLVLNINTHGGMGFTLNEILVTPRGVQELMNQKGSSHEIVVHIDGVRTFDRRSRSVCPSRRRRASSL